MQTMGTPWEIELEGAILFFEDTHTPPYYLDGQLVQLAHAGKLEQVAGVVVGQMDKSDYGDLRPFDWARSRTIEDVLEERLEPLGVPVVYGFRSATRSTSRRFRSASRARSTPTRRRSRSTSRLFASRVVLLLAVDEEAGDGADELRAQRRPGRPGRL